MNKPLHPLPTAGLVILQGSKLLLAFSKRKQAFYLPGGKLDEGETALTALIREAEEELGLQLTANQLQYYCHISAPAYGEPLGVMMEQACFLLTQAVHPIAMAEIGEIRYFDKEAYLQEPVQVPGVLLVFDQLRKDGLL